MSRATGDIPYEPEECWACNGYGVAIGPLVDGYHQRCQCPWCRGTGVLFEGSHEKGQACACHMGQDYVPGDHYARYISNELPEPIWRRYCDATNRDPETGASRS